MKKNFLIIVIIIVIIVIITTYIIFSNKKSDKSENNLITQLENNMTIESNNDVNNNISNSNSDKNPKDLKSLKDIPTPDSIIFYHNGVQKEFVRGTDEFNEIIILNNRRDTAKLGPLQLVVDIDGLLKNTDMLEYSYQNYDPIYFNLISAEQLKKDNIDINWVSVGYDSKVFNQFIYGGLLSADDLINYLNSLK